jgi:hypothetical protein
MCAMSGKPRCAAARSAIHTIGEAKLFRAARHFVGLRDKSAARRPLPCDQPEPEARESRQLAVYQPIRAILRAPREAALAFGNC